MPVSEIEYLERFIECSRLVEHGKRGAIRDDKFLHKLYVSGFYHILREYGLEHTVSNVRAETIFLLADLRDPSAMRDISDMRHYDVGTVSDACIAYLTAIKDEESVKKDLFDILAHRNGVQFRNAAMRMGKIATDKDIPELRRIYGQVDGQMRENMKECLTAVLARYPELDKKRRFILSVPVFPDENAFDRFMDKSIVYLDIRYRDSVAPLSRVSMKAYNNVVKAIHTMQLRIYNERDNLRWYHPSKADVIKDLEALILWAAGDLKEKEVYSESLDVDVVTGPKVDLLDSSNS